MHHTDNTSIDDVASEADENDFSDLSDEALDRPPGVGGGEFTCASTYRTCLSNLLPRASRRVGR